MIAGVSVTAVVVTFAAICIIIYCMRRRNKIGDSNEVEQEDESQNKEVESPDNTNVMPISSIRSDNKIFMFKESVEQFD